MAKLYLLFTTILLCYLIHESYSFDGLKAKMTQYSNSIKDRWNGRGTLGCYERTATDLFYKLKNKYHPGCSSTLDNNSDRYGGQQAIEKYDQIRKKELQKFKKQTDPQLVQQKLKTIEEHGKDILNKYMECLKETNEQKRKSIKEKLYVTLKNFPEKLKKCGDQPLFQDEIKNFEKLVKGW